MSLEDCPSCGKRISEKARNCPKCGDPLEADWVNKAVSRRWRARGRRLVVIVFGVFGIAWISSGFVTKKEPPDPFDELKALAVDNALTGQPVRQSDFPVDWNLNVRDGLLRCELGPVFQGSPRPYVLFEANGKTYALNGAAIGTGQYSNSEELWQNNSLKMVSKLISLGTIMCRERSEAECGTKAEAYGKAMAAVKRRLKNPSDADFVSSHLSIGMVSCGVWRVENAVDATNAFGATVRTYFTALAERSPSGVWSAQVEFRN